MVFNTCSDGYCKTNGFLKLFRTDAVKPMLFASFLSWPSIANSDPVLVVRSLVARLLGCSDWFSYKTSAVLTISVA